MEEDIDLIRRVLDHEPEAQEELAQRATDIFRRVAIGKYRLPADQVQDLSQEFFIRLVDREFHRLLQWRQESPLDAWLRRIADNLCKDFLRSRGRERRREAPRDDETDILSEILSDNPGPFSILSNYERIECVRRAINGLSPRDRRIIELWSEDLPYKEIAELLDINANNAGVAINRAKSRLERELLRLYPEFMDGKEV